MKAFFVILFVVCLVGPVSGGSFEVDAGNGQLAEQLYIDKTISGSIGMFAYAEKIGPWSQFYAGPTLSLGKGVSLSIGLGMESGSRQMRRSGSIGVGTGRFSAIYVRENGGSGLWDRWEADYQVAGKFGLGLTDRVITRFDKGYNGVITCAVNKQNTVKISFGQAGEELSWVIGF